MEYWSVEKKDVNPLVITPILQPVTPKSHPSVTKGDTPKSIEIENSHEKMLHPLAQTLGDVLLQFLDGDGTG